MIGDSTDAATARRRCLICTTPGVACGDDHMHLPPVDLQRVVKGRTAVAEKLNEYRWMNGNMEMTGLLTEQQAERVGAERIGEVGGVEPLRPQQMGIKPDGDGTTQETAPVTSATTAPSKVRKASDK